MQVQTSKLITIRVEIKNSKITRKIIYNFYTEALFSPFLYLEYPQPNLLLRLLAMTLPAIHVFYEVYAPRQTCKTVEPGTN